MSSTDEVLAGRVALVTGGSGGIGAALCRSLADAGADVAVGYSRGRDAAESLAASLGGRSAAFGADLAQADAPAALIESVERALGPVEILVVNHGHARSGRWEQLDAAGFDLTLAVNLRAPFLLAQAALVGMRSRGFGRILFVSSTAAFRGGVIGPDYASSKAGLHGLTYFLASRVAAEGVTVNALAPGFIDTPMLPGDASELARSIPVGRVGRPSEVADFALSVLRNGYLTAHVFDIDGGMNPR